MGVVCEGGEGGCDDGEGVMMVRVEVVEGEGVEDVEEVLAPVMYMGHLQRLLW